MSRPLDAIHTRNKILETLAPFIAYLQTLQTLEPRLLKLPGMTRRLDAIGILRTRKTSYRVLETPKKNGILCTRKTKS